MKERSNTFIVLVMLLFLSQHVFSEQIKQNSNKYLLEKITDQSTEYPAIFFDEESSILFTRVTEQDSTGYKATIFTLQNNELSFIKLA